MTIDPITIILTGLFTGFGVVIGQYISQKYIIDKMEKNIDLKLAEKIRELKSFVVKQEKKRWRQV